MISYCLRLIIYQISKLNIRIKNFYSLFLFESNIFIRFVPNKTQQFMTVIKSISGIVIYESNQATIKTAIEDAVIKKVNLTGANFRSADLRSAYLTGANLTGAYLTSSDLTGANFRGAYLTSADLRCADFTGADLAGAYLTSSDLRGAELTSADLTGAIKLPIYCKWSHGITDGLIHIGCENRSIEDWDIFFNSNQVIQTPRNTEEFKKIQAVYLAYRAYLTHLQS